MPKQSQLEREVEKVLKAYNEYVTRLGKYWIAASKRLFGEEWEASAIDDILAEDIDENLCQTAKKLHMTIGKKYDVDIDWDDTAITVSKVLNIDENTYLYMYTEDGKKIEVEVV